MAEVRKRPGPRLAGVLMMTSCLMMAGACASLTQQNRERDSLKRKLESAIARKRGNKAPVVIVMSQLTDFDWDRMFGFSPYTGEEEIHRTLGYKWNGARGTGIDSLDRFKLLVFTKDGKVVSSLMYERILGEFSFESKVWLEALTREAAIFDVTEVHDEGWSDLVLTPVG